ncbi:MAG: hypothetical protein SO098_08830 [Prevotella sp.]|nr:hypothetical protein [Prevotella sp.]
MAWKALGGGQGCAYGLSFTDNGDGQHTITVHSYTDGSDDAAKAKVRLVIPEKVEENGVTYTVTRIDNDCSR